MPELDFFADKNLIFKHSLHGMSKNRIDILCPHEFKGKDFFVKFYLSNNGGCFSGGAYFYRDTFYTIKSNDYNLMEIEGFNFIQSYPDEESPFLLSINEVWDIRRKYSESIKEFAKQHFPFAGDAGDNDYWLDMGSGNVKYIRWESDDNPDNAIIVAPTFYDFCMGIQANRRVN
ncbi:TPA: SMI1/KNR4 family protein [Klebsiella aerogenes]|nr:SMI1/KNR4 family protein [Klebsiella aerogenes]